MTTRRTALSLLVIALAASACGGSGSPGASTPPAIEASASSSQEVAIQGFNFEPSPLEIETGATVTWTNADSIAHTVTSGEPADKGVPGVREGRPAKGDGFFDEELPQRNSVAEVTFDEAGTFTYYCAIHESMVGEVIVE